MTNNPLSIISSMTHPEWLLLPLGFGVVLIVAKIFAFMLAPFMGKLMMRILPDTSSSTLIERPIGLVIASVGLQVCIPLLSLGKHQEMLLGYLITLLLSLGGLWLGFCLIDGVSSIKITRLQKQGNMSGATIIPMVKRFLKILLTIIVVLAVVQNFGVNIGALLAGLGIGGLAVALAGQKTIENLFGGVVLILDQPIKIGDNIKLSTDLTGQVVDIGLRSTRIRTQDRSIISIPNAEFSQSRIENQSSRDKFLFQTSLLFSAELTKTTLDHLIMQMKQCLNDDPMIIQEGMRVGLIGIHTGAYTVEVYAYINTRDGGEYIACRESLLFKLIGCIEQAGVSLFSPMVQPNR